MNLTDLDAALNRPGILLPGAEWERLDPGSYKLRLPGSVEWIRVTTSAEVFDDHPESHEFLSPGGPLFEDLAGREVAPAGAQCGGPGYCWLVEAGEGSEMLILTPEGPARVRSLGELLDRLDQFPPGGGDAPDAPPAGATLRCLA